MKGNFLCVSIVNSSETNISPLLQMSYICTSLMSVYKQWGHIPGEWHSTTRRKPHFPPCDGGRYWGPCLEGEELEELTNVLYKPEYLLESYTWVKSHKGPIIWRYKVTGRKVSCIALCLLFLPLGKSLDFMARIQARTQHLPQWPSHQGSGFCSLFLWFLHHYSFLAHTSLDKCFFPPDSLATTALGWQALSVLFEQLSDDMWYVCRRAQTHTASES